uniref:Putative dna-directed rna polymerase iii subunit rpc4 n=1 Tax=Ixodes ricinus TaxID=34613 RepID=A0A131XXQ0_IXORI
MSGPANGTPGKSSPQLPRGVLARSGTPFPPGARLPSLRAPRDLTLSGGAQKRTFAPNVSAPRRAPTKDNDSGSSVAEGGRPGRGGHRGGRGGERGRNRGRGRAQLIQTQGSTFADGLGEATRRPGARHSVASSDSSSAPERPKYVPSHTLTAKEKQEDDKRLALLLRSDFIDDGDQEASRLHPVTLPLACVKKEEEDAKPVVVKKEKMDPDEEGAVATALPAVKVEPQVALARAPMAELCMDPNMPEVGQLLFFQFPDTLPGLVPEQQAPPKGKPGQGTNPAAPPPKAEPEQKEPGKRLTLADFPEGYVGKLQVLRSGRSRLLLGSVALTLERGTLVSFHQDLASLKATSEEGGGHLTILGQVPHKLICLPDVQALLGAYVRTL